MFKNEEGFSLLELVVAVGVAGIIAAVALPTFAGLQDKATTTSATYAASASAAEALANSTIGNTGGSGSSSSSSAAASSSAVSNALVGATGTWYFQMGNVYFEGVTMPVELQNNFSNYKLVISGDAGELNQFNNATITYAVQDGMGYGLRIATGMSMGGVMSSYAGPTSSKVGTYTTKNAQLSIVPIN